MTENKAAAAPSYMKPLIASQIKITVVLERRTAAAGSLQPLFDESELRLKKATRSSRPRYIFSARLGPRAEPRGAGLAKQIPPSLCKAPARQTAGLMRAMMQSRRRWTRAGINIQNEDWPG